MAILLCPLILNVDVFHNIDISLMNKMTRIRAIIVLILGFIALSIGMKAQSVQLKGKTFYAVKDSSSKSQSVKTDYVYVDKESNTYPVYLSKNGKAYIIRTSKKTGKEYKQYLPKVTEMFNQMKSDGKHAQ